MDLVFCRDVCSALLFLNNNYSPANENDCRKYKIVRYKTACLMDGQFVPMLWT